MSKGLFHQNIIAVIWDFDKTLIPGYMEEPLFKKYGVKAEDFWNEVNHLPLFYKKQGLDIVSRDTIYLNHIITYVKKNIFKGLNNKILRDLGKEIEFYPGVPEFLKTITDVITNCKKYATHNIQVEHYVVSTGLRQIILGSKINDYVDGVWACEFIEDIAPPGYIDHFNPHEIIEEEDATTLFPDHTPTISDIGYSIDNTSKTRAIFEINKGSNKNTDIDVNSMIKAEDRRIPFKNMLYIADGPSDIPVFSILNQYGGKTYAVYKKGNESEFKQVKKLLTQNRVNFFGEANYQEGSQTFMWILNEIKEIADRIVADIGKTIHDRIGQPPRHLD